MVMLAIGELNYDFTLSLQIQFVILFDKGEWHISSNAQVVIELSNSVLSSP